MRDASLYCCYVFLEAAMQCYVASKLNYLINDTIDVPDELA